MAETITITDDRTGQTVTVPIGEENEALMKGSTPSDAIERRYRVVDMDDDPGGPGSPSVLLSGVGGGGAETGSPTLAPKRM